MRTLIVIPARLGSTRFPRKLLADLNGTPLLKRTYENACKAILANEVVVATEDQEIAIKCIEWNVPALLTSKHLNGTDRMMELYYSKSKEAECWVNVQGDEPCINPKVIDQLIEQIHNGAQIATAVAPIIKEEELFSPHCVKCVFDQKGMALYFSRSPIPSKGQAYRHIGIYAFHSSVMDTIATLEPTPLQLGENLEQLKILEHGLPIKVAVVEERSFGIDTPEDLERLKEALCQGNTSSSQAESSPLLERV